jgi:copper chaperone CopZ
MLFGTPRTFIGSTTFTIGGMRCADDRRAIIEKIAAVPGVVVAVVDLATGSAMVQASEPVDRAEIAAAIAETGFALLP